MQSSESFYRQIAGEGATYIGLLLVVYDTLAADLRRAGQAADRADIAARCEATNHAILLLGHLESWTDTLDDATLQASLRHFYGYIRTQTMLLQANPKAQPFFDLASLVGDTRAAWQQRESQPGPSGAIAPATLAPQPAFDEVDSSTRHSWSA